MQVGPAESKLDYHAGDQEPASCDKKELPPRMQSYGMGPKYTAFLALIIEISWSWSVAEAPPAAWNLQSSYGIRVKVVGSFHGDATTESEFVRFSMERASAHSGRKGSRMSVVQGLILAELVILHPNSRSHYLSRESLNRNVVAHSRRVHPRLPVKTSLMGTRLAALTRFMPLGSVHCPQYNRFECLLSDRLSALPKRVDV